MNQTTGDSKKKQITGGVVVKGEEKELIQVPEGTDFETGALVKLAQNPETAIEIKVGNVQIVNRKGRWTFCIIYSSYRPSFSRRRETSNTRTTRSHPCKI